MKQFLKDYGTAAIFTLQVGWFAVVWWYRKSVATKEDIAAVNKRIDAMQRERDGAPNADDIASLRLEMSHHTGQMRAFSAELTGVRETINAKVDGLDRVLDRAESLLDTLTQHLLASNK